MAKKVVLNIMDSDPGFVKTLMRLRGPGKTSIGYFRDQGSNSEGTPFVEQAAKNELGTETIPSRPFLRRPFDQQRKNIINKFKSDAVLVIAGKKTREQVLIEVSKDFIKSVQRMIDVGPWLANAPSTVAKKGFNKPLIEKGKMSRKITYRLSKK